MNRSQFIKYKKKALGKKLHKYNCDEFPHFDYIDSFRDQIDARIHVLKDANLIIKLRTINHICASIYYTFKRSFSNCIDDHFFEIKKIGDPFHVFCNECYKNASVDYFYADKYLCQNHMIEIIVAEQDKHIQDHNDESFSCALCVVESSKSYYYIINDADTFICFKCMLKFIMPQYDKYLTLTNQKTINLKTLFYLKESLSDGLEI